jgi:hypothetical protein
VNVNERFNVLIGISKNLIETRRHGMRTNQDSCRGDEKPNPFDGRRVRQGRHPRTAIALGLIAAFAAPSLLAADMDVQQKLESLQREIDALKAQMKTQPAAAPQPARSGPEVSFGGQYRINTYSADNDVAGEGKQTAARTRIRQNIDIKFDERFKTHLQMELGHTTDNVTTTAYSDRARGGDANFNVRHAVLDYTTVGGVNLQAGIVPLSDYFGDTQFSRDWNYNPLAVSVLAPVGAGTLRAFAGALRETVGTGGETVSKDDTTHYQLDYRLPLSGNAQFNLGASYVTLTPDVAAPFRSGNHGNYGVGAQFELGRGWQLNGFVLGSTTDKVLLAPGAGNGSGAAVKLELTGGAGPGKFGLLVTYATGKSNGTGFLPVMALARTNGYWGYTGILTVQGPTDTGFDGDSVNLSNNGYGLSTVQAKFAFPVTADLTGYVAAGWFGNTKAPAGRSGDVGTDLLLMGTYRFNKYLALDFGGAFARLKDSVSGYSNGIVGGAAFNQGIGVSRNKNALFARLQAEF